MKQKSELNYVWVEEDIAELYKCPGCKGKKIIIEAHSDDDEEENEQSCPECGRKFKIHWAWIEDLG